MAGRTPCSLRVREIRPCPGDGAGDWRHAQRGSARAVHDRGDRRPPVSARHCLVESTESPGFGKWHGRSPAQWTHFDRGHRRHPPHASGRVALVANDVNDASGPAGLVMPGCTWYVLIGIGDSILVAAPGSPLRVGNPNPCSDLQLGPRRSLQRKRREDHVRLFDDASRLRRARQWREGRPLERRRGHDHY